MGRVRPTRRQNSGDRARHAANPDGERLMNSDWMGTHIDWIGSDTEAEGGTPQTAMRSSTGPNDPGNAADCFNHKHSGNL